MLQDFFTSKSINHTSSNVTNLETLIGHFTAFFHTPALQYDKFMALMCLFNTEVLCKLELIGRMKTGREEETNMG